MILRLFKKKASFQELRKLEKNLQIARSQQQTYNQYLETRMKMLTQIAMRLSPLSKEFSELKQQFGELTEQFRSNSPQLHQSQVVIPVQPNESNNVILQTEDQNDLRYLRPQEQKSLVAIGKLQDESRTQEILISNLQVFLYPDRISKKTNTSLSNILTYLSPKNWTV